MMVFLFFKYLSIFVYCEVFLVLSVFHLIVRYIYIYIEHLSFLLWRFALIFEVDLFLKVVWF
jgi:hypothetical protein